MTIKYYPDLVQGTAEWLEVRRGLLTASEMHHLVTPTLKVAANDKTRSHLYELAAQRISGFVEAGYEGYDMLRGREDEIDAYDLYREKYADPEPMGFITNDRWGFTIGCSPDGLVGSDGGIEIKSRKQKLQVEMIVKNVVSPEHVIQVQTCLLVTERSWWDYLSYSAGLPMARIRTKPDPAVQAAILEAATAAEAQVGQIVEDYQAAVELGGFHPTPRRIERELSL